MFKTGKKILCTFLVVIMCLTSAPLQGFVGLEFTAKAVDYKVGDIIQFGSYPQSKVTDSATITALNNKAPAWDNWTSYGYYTGTGSYGTMKQGDWMRYTDIIYNGTKYRGVKFTQYRPNATNLESVIYETQQDDNGFYINTTYWFKFEYINWRVLDPNTGLIMCETIIDSQPFNNTVYYNYYKYNSNYFSSFSDSSCKNFASNYEKSSIRKWLNNDFYNVAFSDSEKNSIETTTLDNSCYHTLIGKKGFEKLDSKQTNDKIFLLSYSDVLNKSYGFNAKHSNEDVNRCAKSTDYAKSQGLGVFSGGKYDGNSYWLLRTADISEGCSYVHSYGFVYDFDYYDGSFGVSVTETKNGIRPALRLKKTSNTPEGNLSKVSGFTAAQTTDKITLKWKKVSNATGYIVYKYDSAKKKYVKLGSTKKTTYKVSDLKKGTTYKFKIKAYKKINDKTYYSDYTALSTATKPGTPTLKVKVGTNSASLSWNKQTGATGYVVYMATSKDGKYSKIATVKGNSKVTYTKKSLKSGKTYYFKVRAYKTVDKSNIYGSYSGVKNIKIK